MPSAIDLSMGQAALTTLCFVFVIDQDTPRKPKVASRPSPCASLQRAG
jgi:hypothetical protein